MRSMTGYGRGVADLGDRRLVIELRTVNHRFLDVKLRLPWPDSGLEAQVTQLVRGRVDRGVVSVSVREEQGGAAQAVRVDVPLARAYLKAIEELREALALKEPVRLDTVLNQPGVLGLGETPHDPESLWKALRPGLEQALSELVATRSREGGALAADLSARLDLIEGVCSELAGLVRESPELYRKRMRERLERVLGSGEAGALGAAGLVDPQRLAQEVAIAADKMDVTEELTRLAAHLVEVRRLLVEAAPAGRRLDFLTQELNREVNTIGSKAQSGKVAARVVDLKAELERMREQIQNVE